jgi:hypothetical protein
MLSAANTPADIVMPASNAVVAFRMPRLVSIMFLLLLMVVLVVVSGSA